MEPISIYKKRNTRKIRLVIYEAALDVLKMFGTKACEKSHYGFCYAIDCAILGRITFDQVYEHNFTARSYLASNNMAKNYPELYAHRPNDKNSVWWFKPTKAGTAKRIKIMEKAISDLKNKIS
jgi:hypothetical protein